MRIILCTTVYSENTVSLVLIAIHVEVIKESLLKQTCTESVLVLLDYNCLALT